MEELPEWTVENGKLHREFVFQDFAGAIGFMSMAAMRIEKLDHHPEWSNVYNRVTVDLVSHDAGAVTARDLKLARILDQLAAPLLRSK